MATVKVTEPRADDHGIGHYVMGDWVQVTSVSPADDPGWVGKVLLITTHDCIYDFAGWMYWSVYALRGLRARRLPPGTKLEITLE
jgi:hypothetical protein